VDGERHGVVEWQYLANRLSMLLEIVPRGSSNVLLTTFKQGSVRGLKEIHAQNTYSNTVIPKLF
jgi:hypothetical protein